jgi:hypothetical protein
MKDDVLIPAFLLCHWYSRGDTPEQNAHKICEMLVSLGKINIGWKNWYKPDSTLCVYNSSDSNTVDGVEKIIKTLLKGQIRADNGKPDIELGYNFNVTSNPKGSRWQERSGISIRCCTLEQSTILNQLSLYWPRQGDHAIKMNQTETQQKVATTIIKIWEPAWLALRDDNNYVYKVFPTGGFMLGWINYLPSFISDSLELPDGWHWEEHENIRFFCFDKGVTSVSTPSEQESFQRMVKNIQMVCTRLGNKRYIT